MTVAASDGQVVVRLATPRMGDYYAPAAAQPYRLGASVATPAGLLGMWRWGSAAADVSSHRSRGGPGATCSPCTPKRPGGAAAPPA